MEDIHYNFKDFAAAELARLTGAGHGCDAAAWRKEVERLSYPRPPKKLEERKIEI